MDKQLIRSNEFLARIIHGRLEFVGERRLIRVRAVDWARVGHAGTEHFSPAEERVFDADRPLDRRICVYAHKVIIC